MLSLGGRIFFEWLLKVSINIVIYHQTLHIDLMVDHFAYFKSPRKFATAKHVVNWQYRPTGIYGPQHNETNA